MSQHRTMQVEEVEGGFAVVDDGVLVSDPVPMREEAEEHLKLLARGAITDVEGVPDA